MQNHNFLDFGQADDYAWDDDDKENSNKVALVVQIKEVDANLPLNMKVSTINARKHIISDKEVLV